MVHCSKNVRILPHLLKIPLPAQVPDYADKPSFSGVLQQFSGRDFAVFGLAEAYAEEYLPRSQIGDRDYPVRRLN